jgi:uncharacterized repeat protein (TIGR01451 family)
MISVVLVLAASILHTRTTEAQVQRPFTARFAQNVQGGVRATANTLMTCPDSDTRCAGARDGDPLSNNSFNMVYVDVDGDLTTFNSSMATLPLPATATSILFAGLYWGGDTSAGSGGSSAPNADLRSQVRFRTPTSGGYTTVAATRVDDIGTDYQGIADVTALVAAGGAGAYTVANVQAGRGADKNAGWALIVIYADATQPLRNMTVFDGFAQVSRQHTAIDIPVSGFQTPGQGRVETTLGIVAYEGDLSGVGPRFQLNGVDLSDGCNPPNNFLNSTICRYGVPFADKTPNYKNQLGFDADAVDAGGILGTNATNATITVTTFGESYFPGAIAFITDLSDSVVTATKTVSDVNGGDVRPGDVLEYTVTVTNAGQGPATGIVLGDPIPVNAAYVPGSLTIAAGANAGGKSDTPRDDQAFFDAANNQVVFNLGTGATAAQGGAFNPGESTTIRFRVQVNSGAADGRIITNRATVTFVDFNLGTSVTINSSAADMTVVNRADLSVTKTAPATVPVGQSVTYTLTIANNGPLPATNTRLSDTLPPGLTVSSATPSQGACSGAPALVCSLGTVQSGQSAAVTIVATATAAGTLANTASVAADQVDPNPSNNSATTGTSVTADADMAIAKAQSAAQVQVGNTVTYTLTARNNGPSLATDVEVSEAIPPGVALVSASPGQGNCTGTGPVLCQLGGMAANASASITVVVRATTPGPLANVATVRAAEDDPDLTNNGASTSASVVALTPPDGAPPPQADLAIAKQGSGRSGPVGARFDYSLVVDNLGPSEASGVTLTEQIPAGVDLLAVTPSQGTCAGTPAVTCSLGTLPVGARVAVSVAVVAQRPGTYTNSASVRGNEPDPNPANNSAVVSASAIARADLSTLKTSSPTFVHVGGTVSYFVVVRNNGPTAARDVRVTDVLPPGTTPVSATPSQGTCTVGAQVVCQLGILANGTGATVGLEVTANSPGTIRNQAQVSAPDVDPDPTNNISTVETRVDLAPPASPVDLAIAIQAPPGPVSVGDRVTFTITVTDLSRVPTAGSMLVLTLPSNVSLVSLTPSQGTCTRTDIVVCQIGDLSTGASATVALTVDAAAPGTASLVGVASGTLLDTNQANNRASAQVTVVGPGAPVQTPTPTLSPPSSPSPATPTPTPAPQRQSDDDTDKPSRLTEEQRQQTARTNRAGLDEYRTEGNVVGVRCTAEQPTPPAIPDSAPDRDDGDVPYAIIVNRDGPQKVRLIGEARLACTRIEPGTYLEADGVKQHEALFDAESVTIRRPRR